MVYIGFDFKIGFGYSSQIFMAIKDACIILAKHENDSTLYTSYSEFKSEKLGDYSYTRDNSHKYLTGVTEADLKIKPYINHRLVLGVV